MKYFSTPFSDFSHTIKSGLLNHLTKCINKENKMNERKITTADLYEVTIDTITKDLKEKKLTFNFTVNNDGDKYEDSFELALNNDGLKHIHDLQSLTHISILNNNYTVFHEKNIGIAVDVIEDEDYEELKLWSFFDIETNKSAFEFSNYTDAIYVDRLLDQMDNQEDMHNKPKEDKKLREFKYKEYHFKQKKDDDSNTKSLEFKENNWNTYQNNILEKLQAKGGSLHLSVEGDIYMSLHKGDEPKKMTKTNATNALCSILGLSNINFFTGSKDSGVDIGRNEVEIVTDKFSITANSEFYKEDNRSYRTSFIPSKYMLVDEKKDFTVPTTILLLIFNLCNNQAKEIRYFINWLAGFFQTRKKPHTAVVFSGSQGSGKGMFAEQVLEPLFGKKYISIVDNQRLASRFNAPWVKDKILYVFNEISIPTKEHRTLVKNKMKPLITDSTIQVEQKGVDSYEQAVVGISIIFSNESLPIEIEPSDRRYYVIQTGESLKKQGLDTHEMVEKIKKDRMPFSIMLKNYEVDWELYHAEAPSTPLKLAIMNHTNTSDVLFVNAIKNKDLDYFSDLKDSNKKLYEEVVKYFETDEIVFDSLVSYFTALHPEVSTDLTGRKIMKKLRLLDPVLFAPVNLNKKVRSSNGRKILKIA